jgi:hypothetical protein
MKRRIVWALCDVHTLMSIHHFPQWICDFVVWLLGVIDPRHPVP